MWRFILLFLQRAYDQIIHDVGLQKPPVVFAVDRAGLVGSDGETHQGIFDLSFLSSIPNMTVMSPKHNRTGRHASFALKSDGPRTVIQEVQRTISMLNIVHRSNMAKAR